MIYSHLLNKVPLIRNLLFENIDKFTNLHLHILKPSPTLVELLYKEETFIKILIEYLSRQSFLVCWKSFYETDLDQISIRAGVFSWRKVSCRRFCPLINLFSLARDTKPESILKKYKHTKTNTQIQTHKYKHTNTNTQKQTHNTFKLILSSY